MNLPIIQSTCYHSELQHSSTSPYNYGNHFPHPLTPLTRGKVSLSASSCRQRTRLCVMQWRAYGSLSNMDTSLGGRQSHQKGTHYTHWYLCSSRSVMHWIHFCRTSSTDFTLAGGPLLIHFSRRSSTDFTVHVFLLLH